MLLHYLFALFSWFHLLEFVLTFFCNFVTSCLTLIKCKWLLQKVLFFRENKHKWDSDVISWICFNEGANIYCALPPSFSFPISLFYSLSFAHNTRFIAVFLFTVLTLERLISYRNSFKKNNSWIIPFLCSTLETPLPRTNATVNSNTCVHLESPW